MTSDTESLPPLRPDWTPEFESPHAVIDAQHKALLEQCHRLADLCDSGAGTEAVQAFDLAFAQLKSLVREHFDTETALYVELQGPDPEDLRIEREEFEALAADIATTAHFDLVELQRFAALWCVGHIAESVRR